MPVLESPPGPLAKIDGREYLYFAGTSYLGLQGHPEVIRAACEAARQYGIGSANSRTAFGTTRPVLEVERRAARMFGLDDAFYYASGWMGNHILAQLPGPESGRILIDEYSHYSIAEAAHANGWPHVTFHHCDPDDLQAKLQQHLKPGERVLVMSDGVFAATGRIAPAARYYDVLQAYPESMLLLDDAHGVGVLGAGGRGTLEHAGLWPHGVNTVGGVERRPYLAFSATLSKAVGGYGGILPGCAEFIRRIKLRSPYFGGASPPPTPIAAATAKAIELIEASPDLRTRLWSNVRLLKDGLRQMGFGVDDTPVPIVCLVIGSADNMRRIQRELMARGIAVAYMAAYSGLGPEGGLRIAVFATHTEAMIRQLLDELRRLA
jgi:8-amino-7-oxononanoate synthase